MFINDKPVAEWPGWHGAGGGEHATHQGKIDLHAGVHKFQYITAFRGWGACTVGWQRPGDSQMVHMNGESFVGTLNTKFTPAENVLGLETDFDWTYEDDLAMEGRRVTNVRFSPLSSGKAFKWEFGDGSSSTEKSPLHVYLEPGVYPVTLDVDGRQVTQKARIQPFRGHLGKPYEKRISEYCEIIKNYPVKDLSVNALMEMGQICHEARNFDAAARAFRGALEKEFWSARRRRYALGDAAV